MSTEMAQFNRYIGIDYSGAETPTKSLKGLRVYGANEGQAPAEVPPPPSPRWYWTRRGIAEWLTETLRPGPPALVGIDHGFSFPIAYFDKHQIPKNWDAFLEDFRAHWPTDEDIYVDFVRDGIEGNGAARTGNSHWRRITEIRARAKSVFQFDCQGSVAKSTHAGIPWLLRIRKELGKAVHFWPFDGWIIPDGVHVIVEVYPSLWSRSYPMEGRTQDQHDAYSVCRWLKEADQNGDLAAYFNPTLSPSEKTTTEIEGWILGVP